MADIFTFHVYDDRTIQYTLAEPIMLEDANVTQFEFRIPKILNGLDMTSWAWWFVYENASTEKYSVPLILSDDEDDPENYSLATYTVDTGMSGKAGRIRFALEVIDADATTSEILHEWHTRTYTTNVISTLQGNEREFTPSEYDLISAKLEEIMEAISEGVGGGTSDDIENASSVSGSTVSDALNSLSDEIANLEGGAPTSVSTVSGMVDTTKIYLYTGSETGYTAGHWYYYSGNQWVDGGIYGQGASLSNAVKTALLQIAEKVVYIDEHGQDYYDDLYNALYPPRSLMSISAVYTQSGEVYDNDSLDALRSGLVVTANWDDGTSTTETEYTLSGTLTTGTSTITVLYEGKTATFTVTVTHAVQQYTITNTLTECTNSNVATRVNELTAYSGTLTANTGYIMGTVSITMGGTDVTATAYDATTGAISIASVTGNITITAEAIEDVGWVSGVPYTIEWSEGGYSVNASGEVVTSSNANDHVSSLLPCHGASAVLGSSNPYGNYFFYDENESLIQAWKLNTGIENPGRCPVPRNAYYVRANWRNSNPETNVTVTPYKFPTLAETTTWELNKYYELEYADGYEAVSKKSELGLCYGAKTLQCALYSRSFIYFYDAEKNQIGNYTIRQNSTTEISIPDGAYYVAFDPGTIGSSGNTNNPWIKFTS